MEFTVAAELSQIARDLRHGAATSVSVTAAYLEAIATYDSSLGAFLFVDDVGALAAAKALDAMRAAGTDLGPLMGLPVALKDHISVEGMPTRAGSDLDLNDITAPEGPLVRRLRRAGCVILGKTRATQRKARRRRRLPPVTLVGYTNAGKSTLLNTLASSHSLAEDKLFATLDPMTRRARLTGGQEILFTDTVGFVQRLPTTLVAAFRATLEEVAEADLLVHVVNAAYPAVNRQVEAVEQVLEEIGAGGRPMVIALNKVDLLSPSAPLELTGLAAKLPAVRVSALQKYGIDDLLRCISENLVLQFVVLDVLIPYARGHPVAQVHQFGTIEHEAYEEGGTHIFGHMSANNSGPSIQFQKVSLRK